MRTYSKKAFQFENSEGEKVDVKMGEFATIPDWAENTPMFKLALSAEEIVIINNKDDEKKVENPKDPDSSKPPKGGK